MATAFLGAARRVLSFRDKPDEKLPLEEIEALYERASSALDGVDDEELEIARGWLERLQTRASTTKGYLAKTFTPHAGDDEALFAFVGGKFDNDVDALERALELAIGFDESWAEEAVKDDYYGALLEDDEFKAIVSLDPRALIPKEHLEREHIERLVVEALGHSDSGANEALDLAKEAQRLAEIAEFEDLQVRALNVLVWMHCFHGDPSYGLELAEKAVALAERNAALDPGLRAETLHRKGLVLHTCEMFEQAEQLYKRAYELRREVYGEHHPYVAKSLGDMSRLVTATGDDEAALDCTQRVRRMLETFLSRAGRDDEALPDALVDHAIVLNSLAFVAYTHGRLEESIELFGEAATSLERVYREGYTVGQLLERVLGLGDSLIAAGETEQQLTSVRGSIERLESLTLSDVPAVRREEIFWRNLRRLVDHLRSFGVSGQRIAEVLQNAIRGQEDPALLQAFPELGSLAKAMADRVNRQPTFLASAAMAFSLALETGDIERAIDDLQSIAIRGVYERLEREGAGSQRLFRGH